MAEVSTFTELYNLGRAEIQNRGPQWTDFNEGSFLDSSNGGASTLADEISRLMVSLFAELFFGTAEGAALDRLAFDRLNLLRNGASNALATLTWTRSDPGTYTIPIGTTFSATIDNDVFEFVSTAAVVVQAADVTVNVPVTAAESGPDHNVPAAAIDTLVDTVTGETGATVTNALAAAGGAAQESDEEFRSRIQGFFFSVRRATVGALRFAALSVAGVNIATVVEDFAANIVYIYVGDPTATGNDALVSLVAEEIENWRAAGIQVQVLASVAENTALTFDIVVAAGSDLAQIASDIREAVEAFGITVGAGQRVYTTALECAAFDANQLVQSAQITSPTGSFIDPSQSQNALRFPPGSVTLNFTEV